MKLRTLFLVLLGLLAFGIILVVTMPASFIASQVAPALPPNVAIEGATGNMWSGEASVRAAPGGVPVTMEKVRWRFKPERLADGKIAFDTSATSGVFEAKMELQRDGTRWHVRDLRIDGDAGGFATIFPAEQPRTCNRTGLETRSTWTFRPWARRSPARSTFRNPRSGSK